MATNFDPIDEQIYDNIESTLGTVTRANGYSQNVGTIVQARVSPMEITTFPGIVIVPSQDVPDLGAARVLRRTMTVYLNVWHKGDRVGLRQRLRRFVGDVQRVMQVDPHRNGLAQGTREGTLTYVYLEETENEMGASLEYHIDYRTSIDDPRNPPS